MLRWTVFLERVPSALTYQNVITANVAVGQNMYAFGGCCTGVSRISSIYMGQIDVHQIDVHVFNTVSLHWTKLPPVTTEREHLEVPSKRYGHTAVLIEDTIYIWGGFTYTWKTHCKVLYAFDVDTHRWFKPKVSGAVPGARRYHSACVIGKVMYVFGGFILDNGEGFRNYNDIYKLDTTAMVWTFINTRGTPAPAIHKHSATVIGTKIFVFGGQTGHIYHNNAIYVFDTEINCWLSTHSSQILPEVCDRHTAFAYNEELYIFGGDDIFQPRTFKSLWKFNPDTFSWKKVKPKGKGPSCSWMSRMCSCMVGDRIILFGGYKPDDLYILDLGPSLKMLCKLAVIWYGLEQLGLPHDIRWELAAIAAQNN